MGLTLTNDKFLTKEDFVKNNTAKSVILQTYTVSPITKQVIFVTLM